MPYPRQPDRRGSENRQTRSRTETLGRLPDWCPEKAFQRGFVANAPAAVVDMERKKQADAESKIAALKESLAKLKK